MRLWNFGCGPLAATGLLRIRDLGTAVQLRVSGLAAARRGMRHIRHRLLRMLRRVVPVKMHADHGWYNVIRCKTRAKSAWYSIHHDLFACSTPHTRLTDLGGIIRLSWISSSSVDRDLNFSRLSNNLSQSNPHADHATFVLKIVFLLRFAHF